MRSPAVAVLWESWRLTRTRLLVVPVLVTLCGWALSQTPAKVAIYFLFFAAAFGMAVALPAFGTRGAFPLSMAFARPIRTALLVAVPLAYVFVAATACYLVPAFLMRYFEDVAIPVVPPALLIGALTVLVAGCTWATRLEAVRFGLVFAGFIVAGLMLRFVQPFRQSGGFPLKVSPQLCVLSAGDCLILALFALGIYLWIVFGVSQQRHGEEGPAPSSTVEPSEKKSDIFLWLRNTCVELFNWRCPVNSPTKAEIWFEMQCYGVPVLVIGALLAISVPLMMMWANESRSPIVLVIAFCAPLAPFAAGVAASIWNRRNSARANVFVFEAARPIATSRLICLQVLVTSLCISGAWALMAVSALASLPLLKDFHDYGSPLSLVIDTVQKYGLRSVSFVIVGFVLLAASLALLAAFRALSSYYGWRFWLGTVCAVIYAIALMIAVAREQRDGGVLGAHIWAFAVAIPVGTVLVLGSALARGVLTLRQVAVALLTWLVFAGLYLDMVLSDGGLRGALPAVAALVVAATFLPLLATGLAPWSLHSLRHA